MMVWNIVNVLNVTELYVQNFEMVCLGTSLVVMVQWLESTFQCRGPEFNRYLGNESPTCHRATKPMCHNY